MDTDQKGNWTVNSMPYTLVPLPRKVENFIRRVEQETQVRISTAFEYILRSYAVGIKIGYNSVYESTEMQ